MANALTASFPEIWAKEQQEVFYKENVAMAVADVSFKLLHGAGLLSPELTSISFKCAVRSDNSPPGFCLEN